MVHPQDTFLNTNSRFRTADICLTHGSFQRVAAMSPGQSLSKLCLCTRLCQSCHGVLRKRSSSVDFVREEETVVS